MRLFIAILFDEETVERLAGIRDSLHDRALRGSFVSRDNLHLTLEFLGECDDKEKRLAIEAMEAVHFEPFDLTIDSIGFFSRQEGDTWWAGLEHSRPLACLQKELHGELAARGLSLQGRPYRPHITLGRRVVTTSDVGRIDPIHVHVDSIDLMLSERTDNGMVYTSLYSAEA